MGFTDAIDAGIALMEREAGTMFTLDGVTGEFKGVFNAHRKGEKLGVGGFREDADAIMVVRKVIIGAVIPRRGQRCMIEGHRYVIDQTEDDMATWTMVMMSEN